MSQRLAEANHLQRLTSGLLRQETLDDVLSFVCGEAQQLTGAEGAKLLLLENEAWLRVFHQTGHVISNQERVPVGDSLSGLAVLQKKSVLINDPANSALITRPDPALEIAPGQPALARWQRALARSIW